MVPSKSVLLLGRVGLPFTLLVAPAAAQMKPPAEPAKITLSVHPASVAPGGQVELQVEFAPIEGVKIARYPQIKVQVDGRDGLVEPAQSVEGDAKPPPPDRLEQNHYEHLAPLRLTLQLDRKAPAGRHELQGDVSYAYCLTGLGCARVKVPVKFPLQVASP